VRLGIKEGMLHRVLGQPSVGSKGILDRILYYGAIEIVGGSSYSKGATTTTTYLMGLEIDLGGGSSISTFLDKSESYILG